MKRAPDAAGSPYAQLCARLGAEPKQVTVLLSVIGGALVLFGGKMMLSKPESAAAATAPAAAAAQPAPETTAAAASPAIASEPGASAAGAHGDASATLVRLDSAPRRDPFRSFNESAKAPKRGASDAPPDESLKAPDLALYTLRATMDGEWVVINDQTLRLGDTVGLGSDGTPIKLRTVGHRSATLEWRGKTFEIAFTP